MGQSMPKLAHGCTHCPGTALEDDHAPPTPGQMIGMSKTKNARRDHGIIPVRIHNVRLWKSTTSAGHYLVARRPESDVLVLDSYAPYVWKLVGCAGKRGDTQHGELGGAALVEPRAVASPR